ncbi:MAG TPA: hypothetical protein VFH61_11425, partial [Thermoleophilia bacterium]|nr:hypothetical protein [Thermoleophilia bacterium]
SLLHGLSSPGQRLRLRHSAVEADEAEESSFEGVDPAGRAVPKTRDMVAEVDTCIPERLLAAVEVAKWLPRDEPEPERWSDLPDAETPSAESPQAV